MLGWIIKICSDNCVSEVFGPLMGEHGFVFKGMTNSWVTGQDVPMLVNSMFDLPGGRRESCHTHNLICLLRFWCFGN